ncbi:XopAW family type III secretion system calcium-binding effector [Roseateles sp. NT4]|uniref:XopAW family type III secretion system calcium-binding effector n=1 Tax=Roseateles sp. NT4 TaxID=3453715 RepID=UPI003EEF1CA9
MSTISGLGGADRSWQNAQNSSSSRRAEHEAKMFAKVDSDGSGSVDATELAAMLEKGPLSGHAGDSAELLKKMDSNGDGSLNSEELSQGMRDLMPPPSSTMEFAQSRGAANDEGSEDSDRFAKLDTDGDGQLSKAEFEAGKPQRHEGGPHGPPPAASSGGSSTSSTSTTYDPLDANQDGTVSQIERLAGQLKELAQTASSDGSQGSANSDIAALAQKLYDQLSKNWLQSSGSDAQLSVTA